MREKYPAEEVGGICSFEHIEQSYINFLNIINREDSNHETVVIPDDLLDVIKWAILAHSRSRVGEDDFPRHLDTQDQLVIHAIRTADKGDYQITDGYEMDQLMDIKRPQTIYTNKDLTIYEKLEHFINKWVEDIQEADEVSDS